MADDKSYMADYMNAQGLSGLYGSNPFLQFTGQIPMAGFYGAPTDAAGNPIASFGQAQAAHDAWAAANPAPAQGTTLNSAPQLMASEGNTLNPQVDSAGNLVPHMSNIRDIASNNGQPDPYGAAGANIAAGNALMGGLLGGGRYGDQYMNQTAANYQQGQQPQQPAAPAASTNPVDMRQAYLDALSNPGKVNTPGAQMLPGTSPTGPQSQPSVLAQFLAQHPGGGTTGGGGYSNQPFFATLNALKQGATT